MGEIEEVSDEQTLNEAIEYEDTNTLWKVSDRDIAFVREVNGRLEKLCAKLNSFSFLTSHQMVAWRIRLEDWEHLHYNVQSLIEAALEFEGKLEAKLDMLQLKMLDEADLQSLDLPSQDNLIKENK